MRNALQRAFQTNSAMYINCYLNCGLPQHLIEFCFMLWLYQFNIKTFLNRIGRAEGNCPAIWDGYLCWEETESDMTSVKPCPAYVYSHSENTAGKTKMMHNLTGNKLQKTSFK